MMGFQRYLSEWKRTVEASTEVRSTCAIFHFQSFKGIVQMRSESKVNQRDIQYG